MISLIGVCSECFVFASSYFYLLYGIVVAALGLLQFERSGVVFAGAAASQGKNPPMPGEVGVIQPKNSIQADILKAALLHGFSFEFFQGVIQSAVEAIRFVFLMRDNPSFLRSFWRYLKLYLFIVPLPAAVLWPVLHPQRTLDFQLMLAAVLMILVNALGDVVSIRLFLWNFESLHSAPDNHGGTPSLRFWRNAKNEALYYLNVARGAGYSLIVLIVVLMLCSILFGVQTGQFDIEFSEKFLTGAWHRAVNFTDLAFEPYWYKGLPAPFPSKGIPGLFLYGIITFIPIIVIFALSILWLLLLPLRIAMTLPGSAIVRMIFSELAVISLCITITQVLHIDLLGYLRLHHA